jgi:hypothetical protein
VRKRAPQIIALGVAILIGSALMVSTPAAVAGDSSVLASVGINETITATLQGDKVIIRANVDWQMDDGSGTVILGTRTGSGQSAIEIAAGADFALVPR